MTTTPEPNWYDVLDVDPTAPTAEIDRAWRVAISDLTPADRRFRLYNQAAEVLLDPERRAAYDGTLAGSPGEPEPRPDPAPGTRATAGSSLAAIPSVVVERVGRLRRGKAEPRSASTAESSAGDGRWLVPGWLLVGIAILAALSVGVMSYLWTQPSEGAVADATGTARTAAERAAVPVLSFDYRTLDEDQQAAHEYLTSDYRREYDRFFDGVVKANAKSTRTTVDVDVIASAVVRSGEDRADILLFLNRPTTNKANPKPQVYKDQATLRMERVGDQWLVDCIITDLTGRC